MSPARMGTSGDDVGSPTAERAVRQLGSARKLQRAHADNTATEYSPISSPKNARIWWPFDRAPRDRRESGGLPAVEAAGAGREVAASEATAPGLECQ
jgi:hypothetical protein